MSKKVRLQIVSDLHIEYMGDGDINPLDYITPSCEILVLAGDIGSLYKIEQLEIFLKRICVHFKMVIYVAGNHEFYTCNGYLPMSFNKLVNVLMNLEKHIPNLYILNQSSIVIEDVCISGITLWSEPKIIIPRFIVRIAGLYTEYYEKMFKNDVRYVENMINYCHEKQLKLVVVSHYSPTYSVLSNHKMKDRFVSLYCSNLDHLLCRNKVNTWVCGHIHLNFDRKTAGGTHLVGNQLGKPRDNITDFDKSKVIVIE